MSQAGVLGVEAPGTGYIEFLTGNTGGAVGPDGSFNINVVGNTSTGISVAGDPSTHTLTISSTGDPNWISGTTTTVGAVNGTLVTLATASNTTIVIFGRVAAWNAANTAAFGGDITAIAKNVAGTVTVIGPPDSFTDQDSALAGSSFTLAVSGTNLILQVTGVTGLTIDWSGGFGYSVAS